MVDSVQSLVVLVLSSSASNRERPVLERESFHAANPAVLFVASRSTDVGMVIRGGVGKLENLDVRKKGPQCRGILLSARRHG